MHCQSCNIAVPSNFKFAFTSNRCPSCGKTIMSNEVKALWQQFDDILSKENHDMGDIAVWLMGNFKLVKLSDLPTEETTPEVPAPVEAVKPVAPVHKDPPVRHQPTPLPTSVEGRPLLDPARVQLFKKRSGVDKIKYETMVKNIQGDVNEVDIGDGTLSSSSSFEGRETLIEEGASVSEHELEMAKDIVAQSGNVGGVLDISELKRIQRLEQMEMNGSVGLIKRSGG